MHYLDQVAAAQQAGARRGLPSICSAHPRVLSAALRLGREQERPVLVEATCNQVNQYGGYTGWRPADFANYARRLAQQAGLGQAQLLLGGDHLGPLPWVHEPAQQALDKARVLVQAYVLAGFSKLHLDCSMPCADERELSVETIARRTADLAAVAEETSAQSGLPGPRYVVGSEVPPAGGAAAAGLHVRVTPAGEAEETLARCREAFAGRGLVAAWERVIALVVQPGVEFGDESVQDYDPSAAAGLARWIEGKDGLVFEAHSTDYQQRSALRALVEDHFAILKVGPSLTFALRQAIFGLAAIETELCPAPSGIRAALEAAMLANPGHWQRHYAGDERQQRLARAFSFSDRARYYWQAPTVQAAFERLVANFTGKPIPLALLSQYLPVQYADVRQGQLANEPLALIEAAVRAVLAEYAWACG